MDNDCFGANYWATGKQISNKPPSEALSMDSLTDTPFQLIKLADFGMMFEKDEKLVKALEALVKPWIKTIDIDN